MEAAAVAETHSGVVFFLGDRAYKLKKPVDLGFLDFRTLAAREEACRAELRLNRRLAPDVYLDVDSVVDGDGEVCEYVLVMRRLPAQRRLTTLVLAGVDVGRDLRHLGRLLANFHAGAERPPEAALAAGPDATRGRWLTNAAQMEAFRGTVFDDDDLDAVLHLALRYLDGRAPLFDARVAAGRAVDGHGDLLADDIFCLDDGPRVLDCIEFDPALRVGDGLADVAFLAMDLERLGHLGLATRFLAAYREYSADSWPASLAHHHIAYRAQVRAKVRAIRAAQGDERAREQAPALLGLARRHLEQARVRLVLVGGLPGTGKTTVASGLAGALEGFALHSDETRKELAGVPADRSAGAAPGEGIYEAGWTSRTYERLLERAGVGLSMGESVVLDATWLDPARRAAARQVADEHAADLVELRCELDPAIAAARIRARVAAGGDASDATPALAESMRRNMAPWPEAAVVDTSGSRDAVDAAVAQVLGTRQSSSVPVG